MRRTSRIPTAVPAIDWAVFDKYAENTCSCRCGAIFRSHTKFVVNASHCGLFSRKPCPKCGKKTDLFRSSSDPETMIISKQEVDDKTRKE